MGNLIWLAGIIFCTYVWMTMAPLDEPKQYDEPVQQTEGLTDAERNALLWAEIGG